MLILTRKLNESITIGEKIKITILEIEKGQVRLGIDAPKHIAIFRKEVYERIQEENKKAVVSKKSELIRLMKGGLVTKK